ncbi:5550_t:CDS:2, partial [Gigaspora rosea]
IIAQSLVQDETISSYKWILKCLLKATNNLFPKTIFINADPVMFGSSYNKFLQSWVLYHNSLSEAELKHHWEELLVQYSIGRSYLSQLWKFQHSWAKIYIFTTFCAGMQSTQQIKSTNGLIKSKVNAKTILLNLVKAIQTKLDCKAQYQRFSEYKNTLPTRELPNLILYYACLFEISSHLTLLPSAHKYIDRYLENKYDALQASFENIMNMVNRNNIFEVWQSFDCSVIMGINIKNQDVEMNQPRITQKQEYAHGFGVDKSRLKFIENYTGINANEQMIFDVTHIENPKKLKHKKCSKIPKSTNQGTLQDVRQDLNTKQNLNLKAKKLKQTAKTDSEDGNFEENSS